MYKEAVDYILKIRRFTKKNSLKNTERLLDALGNPQNGIKFIHVAGTNGKGSVCAYINQILLTAGKSTGLFTSPHLVKINERIRINNEEISDDEFYECYTDVMQAIDKLPKEEYYHPSFFEFIFLMALDAFHKAGAEYVILETGLGGRLDATNVIRNPIITVITKIALDHTEILGNTISEIAYEKAGIIKEKIPVVFSDNNPESTEVILKRADALNTDAYGVKNESAKISVKDDKKIDFCMSNGYYEGNVFTIYNPAEYQVMNAALALKTAELIGIKDKSCVTDALKNTIWEGRMEEVLEDVYLDGAHNPDAVAQFVDTVNEIKGSKKICLLFSVVNDKNYDLMIDCICKGLNLNAVVLSPLNSDRAVRTDELKQKFIDCGVKSVYETDSVEDGFEKLISVKGQGIAVCAGSLYLVGEVKSLLRRKNNAQF